MSHTLIIHNKSPHNQEFEVHGWNNNHNIKGFAGNDFFDISNITGAGGNMTIMHVGHPTFMQALNKAWQHADQRTKDGIRKSLHLDSAGKIVRMDATKDNSHLETFVRTFDDQSYVGVGAWNGKAGDSRDHIQSRVAVGNKDILITYSDGDARPDSDNSAVIHTPTLVAKQQAVAVRNSHDGKKPGISLTNRSTHDETYFFYDNYWNGNGTAGANFDHPLKSIRVSAGQTVSVDLPSSFKGRVQRGSIIPATWVEFQLEATNDHKAHGDVSVEQGNDGPAMIRATDGTNTTGGFTTPVHAAASAYQIRSDGQRVIASTMGNWLGGPNQAAIESQKAIKDKVYVTGGTGVPDVASANNRLAIDFY
ncbi:hypothetical protein D6D28_09302 [Aureobasidium pullulans]|uniref:Uncharacterized protein n=1 Tax=Aureobasidium pullulans TaxID=5580 RepID=A0A4S8S4V9_AURPU|nr:hypothetical protein D6D28_09302 [Aureobasidium pullulans]